MMAEIWPQSPPALRLGISRCLLGDKCRWDGRDKRDAYLIDVLSRHVEWVAVCPEWEMGLGVPREPMSLLGMPNAPRLVTNDAGIDHTEPMVAWTSRRLDELAALKLHGFVLKARSPSCGLFEVPVYAPDGSAQAGAGLFAAALRRRFPLLPIEEEGRLRDGRLLEVFVEHIYVQQRWQKMLDEEPTAGGLVRFHTAHKLTLMAHSTIQYRALGRLVASAGVRPWDALVAEYAVGLHKALVQPATPAKHVNVLQHLMGYMKHSLSSTEKAELLESIDSYRAGLIPWVVPVTLLQHHLRRHLVPEWVFQQVYLNPYPAELLLRNDV